MSRLASFRGPSTPTASPVQKQHIPTSPSRIVESPYHRKVRTLLQELRSISNTWDDIVLIDGLKAAKSLVDIRTDLDNELSLLPNRQPYSRLVGPRLTEMEKFISELDYVLNKLRKQFRRMTAVIENLETLLIEAYKVRGWRWITEEPLWVSWPLEKFVILIPEILVPYHRSLDLYTHLVNTLRGHSLSFEDSRDVIIMWAAQPWLEGLSWEAKWEDICDAEVERWNLFP